MAINDPSRWTRRMQITNDEWESMAGWITRAITEVLDEWLAGRTVLELPAGTEADGAAYFASPAEDNDVVAEVDVDGKPLITDGIRLFDDYGAEAHALALLAAVRAGRRLASESSGDGEAKSCEHAEDRIENDEVTADEHARVCLSRGDGDSDE
jgi:hypothetical protein